VPDFLEPPQAEVVLAPLEERARGVEGKPLAEEREVAAPKLFLEGAGAGCHHRPPRPVGEGEEERDEVPDRLPRPRAGLKELDPSPHEGLPCGLGVGELPLSPGEEAG